MSRDEFDIPEVFRRAMEEAGWRDGGNKKEDGGDGGNGGDGGDGGDGRPPLPRRPEQPPQINRSLWIFGLLLILLLSFNWIVTTYTDWLWFNELTYQSVWLKQWGVRVLSFVVFFVLAAAFILSNWLLARRRASQATNPFNPQFLNLAGVRWLIIGAGLFLAFVFGSGGAGQWEALLRYVYRVPFGVVDPIFNRDVGFYLFELPVFEFVRGWLLSLLFFTLLGAVAIYAINHLPDIQRGAWRPQAMPALRRHVSILGALFLGLWSLGYLFNIYGLLYSPDGVIFGAGYTDMNATLWALRAQLVLMGLAALALLLNAFRPNLRPLLVTGALWLATALLLGGVYPGLLQRYAVEPNEIERERPYIEHNIEFTRLAFGLDQIEKRPFDTITDLSQQDLLDNEAALQNVRVWDYRPLQRTYEQLQALRPYYEFSDIDIDRYVIDGQIRQVMLAARELDKTNLPAPSWVNRNLEFTHGYGIVMNPVDRISPEGQPEFYIQDLPPRSSVDLEVTRPEIYYGEMTTDTVFVGSGREEFSYPSGATNVYSSYAGTGGVPLDSYLKRLAFAIRLGDINVLLSNEITNETRVQYNRMIQNRVSKITPFLALDGDPYLVLFEGRLFWIQDAYTLSDKFPYATPTRNRYNYIRNAAKIVIDAYNGTVDYYLAAPDDPITQTYDRAFPGLFKPLSELPEGLEKHLRYPEDLFTIQAQQFLTYHMTDVRVFYNKEDLWQIPREIVDGEQRIMEPYYVILKLPGSEETEYLLIQPITPANRSNLIAWMAARNDMPNYGEIVVYELPKQELVFGPIQIEGRIDQEPEISQQFSLWDQGGSRVIRGNLIVIPLNNSFLYVEPVYLLSATSALPELKRVIVASDSRIAMRETLDEALTALLLDAPAVGVIVEDPDTPLSAAAAEAAAAEAAPTPAAPTAPPVSLDAPVEALIQAANTHFEAAEAAQRAGDWATYGRELEALRQTLERLAELTRTDE